MDLSSSPLSSSDNAIPGALPRSSFWGTVMNAPDPGLAVDPYHANELLEPQAFSLPQRHEHSRVCSVTSSPLRESEEPVPLSNFDPAGVLSSLRFSPLREIRPQLISPPSTSSNLSLAGGVSKIIEKPYCCDEEGCGARFK